jgi:hypothetical protein
LGTSTIAGEPMNITVHITATLLLLAALITAIILVADIT